MSFGSRFLPIVYVLAITQACDDSYEIRYYGSGAIESKMRIKNGVPDGEILKYYEDGNLMGRGFFRSGKLEGDVKWFFENGDLEETGFYKNGKLDGTVKKYYRDGHLRVRSGYKDGKHSGQDIHFRKDGRLSELTCYDSLGNLYYMTKWDSDGKRVMQAFIPIFSVDTANDSTHISARCDISFFGSALLSIGTWDGNGDIIPKAKIKLKGMTPSSAVFKTDIDPRSLFYKVNFQPSDSDTITGFEFTKKVIQSGMSDETNSHFEKSPGV